MSARRDGVLPADKITLDQIKHRAEEVKEIATTDTKAAVSAVVDADATRTLLAMAGVVVLAASLAYYLGSRACRATLSER